MRMLAFFHFSTSQRRSASFHGCELFLHSSLCQRLFQFLVAAGILNPIVHTIK
jgi:hypothetical protein